MEQIKRPIKRFYFLVGANGCGKNEVVNILSTNLSKLKVMISHTTRDKRDEERDNKDYHFITDDVFDSIKSEFMEYTIYNKKSYGHNKSELLNNVKDNNHFVFIIEPAGIYNILEWLHTSYEGKKIVEDYELEFTVLYVATKKSVRLKRLLNKSLLKSDSYDEDFSKTENILKRLQRENDGNDDLLTYMFPLYQKYFKVILNTIDNNDTIITLKTKYLNPIIEKGNDLNYYNSLRI